MDFKAVFPEPGKIHEKTDFIRAYMPPDTLGEKPEVVGDACLDPIRTTVAHAFDLFGSEGVPVFPGYTVLCGLTQNGLIRSGVEMRAKEMTRTWGELVSTKEDSDRIPALTEDMERFHIQGLFRQIAEQCGFMGGCLVYVDTGDVLKDVANPLVLESKTFRRDSLKGFRIIDPWVCSPQTWNSTNPLGDNYYKPDVWTVYATPVSSTRLIRFVENELPNMLKPAYNFLGLSLSQKVLDAVSHYTRNRESASKLLEKISLVVLKTDMTDVLMSGDDGGNLALRLNFFAKNWNFDGVAAIDKEAEDIAIFNNSISGIVDIVRQSMEYVAAMFNEPATKLWGISPAGMNATGESDMRNHYENIASLQEQIFRDGLNRVIDILQMNRYGDIDTAIQFKFAPLSDEADREKAEVNKIKAETAEIYSSLGAVGQEEVRNALIADPDSGYNNLTPYTAPEPVEEWPEESQTEEPEPVTPAGEEAGGETDGDERE